MSPLRIFGLRPPARWGAILLLQAAFAMPAQQVLAQAGPRFRIHTVEQGQTLFAISRAYAVPVEALLEANPDARDGLSIGQEIRIPMEAVQRKEVRTAPTMQQDGELEHTVARKETLFGIARRYGVDMNALLERNPEANSGLREGMVLVIPVALVQGQPEAVVRPAMPEVAHRHTVQPGETLYALGKLYNVDPEAIRSANDGLPEGLKAGDTIVVPLRPGTVPPVAEAPPPMVAGRAYKVALLLPFSLDRNDSLRSDPRNADRFHGTTHISAQFYAGARMALDSLRQLGLSADVNVLDVGETPATWTPVLRRPELNNVDLFVGPFHRSAIEQLALGHGRSHIVCPVPQTNKVILGQPTVSKVTPTRADLLRHAGRYVAQRHAMDRIILLQPDIHADKDLQDQLGRALRDNLARQAARGPDSLLVARPGRRDLGDLPGKLHADRLNVLVAPSEDVEYVSTLVSKLKPLAGKYRIKLVGLGSWQDMGTVTAADLDLLGFTFPEEGFMDTEDPRTVAFIRAFRERFGSDVDQYALMGFDVMMFYGRALLDFGTAFPKHLQEVRTEPLYMGFRMTRTGPENGFRNEYAVMLQQRELRLERAR